MRVEGSIRHRIIAVACVGLFGACTDSSGPGTKIVLQSLVVSNPIGSVVLASPTLISSSEVDQDSIVYVSLPPGTAPGGTRAIVRRVGGAVGSAVSMFDGGFDPVSLVAHTGDSIDVIVTGVAGDVVQHTGLSVAARRPPVVVRTQPPPRKRDHPLNAPIIIVFSEPVRDPAAQPGSVRLQRGSDDVPGTVQFLDPSLGAGNVSVEFVPNESLEAAATYRLIVTQQVRDLTGDALEAPDTVEFTTGQSLTGGPATLALSIDSALFINLGTSRQLTATVRDSAGNELTDQPVTWSVTDSTIATVSSSGLVSANTPGVVLLAASAGQATDFVWIIATNGPPAFVTIDPAVDSIDVGRGMFLTATVRDSLGQSIPDMAITGWSLDDSSRAWIDLLDPHTARLFAVHSGTVTVTATAGLTLSGAARITVVSKLASVTLSPDSLRLVPASVGRLTATLNDSTGGYLGGYGLLWASDNPSVATIDVIGRVTALSSGSATISATSEGITGSAHIAVATATFVSVSAGYQHTCGVTATGAAYCWGANYQAQLGMGQRDTNTLILYAPAAVIGGLDFSAVTAGGVSTCGVTTDAMAYCWGGNTAGELGRDSISFAELRPDSVVASSGVALRFSQVSAGIASACGLTSQNAAYCWGGYPSAPLGPRLVSGGVAFAALSVGGHHQCGLAMDAAAFCWGANNRGQLGDASTTDRAAPVPVAGGLAFVVLSAGGNHSCGATSGGAAYCWGANDSGELGDSSVISRTTPAAVRGGVSFTALSAGASHTCGLTSGGIAYCWGLNNGGQLGDGTMISRTRPAPVAGGLVFASVSAGGIQTCGLTTGGVLYCWGRTVGDGTGEARTVPVKVLGQP